MRYCLKYIVLLALSLSAASAAISGFDSDFDPDIACPTDTNADGMDAEDTDTTSESLVKLAFCV
ncbi:hypothetical protein QCA50_008577 [Cerrena zonata]|uniref:Secreted protein n=1 Tax=Cerrena zonata TaxID=2478898 RepID=A0AAW0G717_9APHY